VLLMDEPASGLDPRARVEIRELLRELKKMGKTILISSHILHELAELCNVVGIIERGRLLFSGTVGDVLRRARVGQTIEVGVVDRVEDAAELLGKVPGVQRVGVLEGDSASGGGRVIHVQYDAGAGGGGGGSSYSDLPNVLINNGFRLTRFHEESVNLETAFMRLTKGLVQ